MDYSDHANPAIAALLMEIEARKKAEASLRKANEEWEELYTNTECGFHSLDTGGTVLGMNDIELFWLGYRREEVVGKMKLTQLISPQCHDDFRYACGFLHEHGWLRQFPYDMLRRDGMTFPIVVNVRAIKDENGKFLRSIASVFDVTALKNAQSELHKLNGMLEQRVRERTAELFMTNKILEAENLEFRRALHEKACQNLTSTDPNRRCIESQLPEDSGLNATLCGILPWSRKP